MSETMMPTGTAPVSSDLVSQQPPDMDKKRAKFEELAVARTKRCIKAIRVLANMGGKNRYAYSFATADVEKIAATLHHEVEQLRTMMVAPGRQLDIEFDLR